MATKRLAVLMTCFNRVNTTLSCLDRLSNLILPDGISVEVFLVDDGSTDSTGYEVRERFPSVNVIVGTGSLYWAGGMRMAWDVAAQGDFDYYLWLNDDTYLNRDSLVCLLDSSSMCRDEAVICSAVVSAKDGHVTYGGKLKGAHHYLVPTGVLEACEIISGNCVLVPKYVYKKIGGLDRKFKHAIADYDYGLRAVANGIACYVAPKIIGTCESNERPPKWCQATIPFFDRVKALYSPLGNAQPGPYFYYIRRHFGLWSAVRQLIAMHVRVVLPRFW